MKKKLLYCAFVSSLIWIPSMDGQVIPNPDFENWSAINYNEPVSWTTSNYESITKAGTITTTSVTGFSGAGVHMQTKIIGLDTLEGYLFYGSQGNDPTKGYGGLPYSQKPSNITGYCRYNLPGNDTALILITFKKNGTILSQEWKKIRGTGTQPTFTPFSYTLAAPTLSVNPDSVIIAFASSNVKNTGIQNNSYLEIDEIAFTGPGITQTITNSSFENWSTSSIDVLTSWASAGSSVVKVTPGYSGNFALQLQTTFSQDNNVSQSGITNGYFPHNSAPRGGKPYTQTLDTLYGYYKFSGSNDSGVVYVNLTKLSSSVGGSAPKYFKNQSNWTLFKVPISAGSTPDSLRLEIYSSQPGTTVTTAVGSKLYIDNLFLYSSNVGIKVNSMNNNFQFFPNPCKEQLIINIPNGFNGSFAVYDMMGNKITINSFGRAQDQLLLNTQFLPTGIYFISLENGNEITKQKFIKE